MHYINFYLAIEDDLKRLSRFIEFSENNMKAYSIETVRILLATCSEIDVILKELCKLHAPDSHSKKIDDYRNIIKEKIPEFVDEEITLPGHHFKSVPWEIWKTSDENPDWWRGHNKVKHQRNDYYDKASLKNTINAVAALYICLLYYYKEIMNQNSNKNYRFDEITRLFGIGPGFIKANPDYYRAFMLV